jgi:hypothetical protein
MSRSPQNRDLIDHAIAFEVATPLLDRAFRKTYGLAPDDLFANVDVAITTYRWAFREFGRRFGRAYREPGCLARFFADR